jgi:flavin reductase (DIM6/NTAB) family NADH-FMN oxidoreductase RutF
MPTTTDPQKALGSALGRIPSGIFVITVAQGGVETGMLASWVQQCSFKPPLITMAVQRGRAITSLLTQGAVFTLNILEANQTDMIAHFGKGFALDQNAFEEIELMREPPHGPILQEALGFMHAKIVSSMPAGDHDVFIAEVTAGRLLDEGQPMVHIRKNGFHY